MINRTRLTQTFVLALPLVLLAVLLAVYWKSPRFQGQRWLREQGRSAVQMKVKSWYSVPNYGYSPALNYKVITSDRAVIQQLLWTLGCVGQLTGENPVPPLKAKYGLNFDITLFYPDGHQEYLMLRPQNYGDNTPYCELVHYGSLTKLTPVLGIAQVKPASYQSFIDLIAPISEQQDAPRRARNRAHLSRPNR